MITMMVYTLSECLAKVYYNSWLYHIGRYLFYPINIYKFVYCSLLDMILTQLCEYELYDVANVRSVY